jgi:hypothetical protein
MAYETITTITKYTWLSTEAKPTGCNDGSTGFERDTGKYYVYSTISGWVLAAMPIVPFDSSGTEIVPATAALQTTGNTKLDSVISALEGYLKQVIYNSSEAELFTITNPGRVTVNGSYPTLRCLSTDTEPTTNTDSSALVKGQLLWIVDTDVWKYWSGTAWVVKE